jgi:hypothetical protein
VIGLVCVAGVDSDPELQRDDWRGAVHALGHAGGDRLIAATPASALPPLSYYLPSARKLDVPAILAVEIDYLAISSRRPGERPKPPRPQRPPQRVAGFEPAGHVEAQTFTLFRMRARAPLPVASGSVAIGLDGKPSAVLVAGH